MKSARWCLWIFMAGLLGLGWMLSPSFVTETRAAAEPYKIGAVFSVTGGGSFLGDPEKKTAEMIAEDINKKGGINGHPVQLIVYDDESDATKCLLMVKKLIKTDEVPVIIGPSLSGTSLAVVGEKKRPRCP